MLETGIPPFVCLRTVDDWGVMFMLFVFSFSVVFGWGEGGVFALGPCELTSFGLVGFCLVFCFFCSTCRVLVLGASQ